MNSRVVNSKFVEYNFVESKFVHCLAQGLLNVRFFKGECCIYEFVESKVIEYNFLKSKLHSMRPTKPTLGQPAVTVRILVSLLGF